ncbi:MAG TPA: hypothetical protein VE593_11480 [Nitrososphaeraceae archaeon]|jgi:hypothetical protein|nr:hypothetical protein [Nitrososphaeraceae archaeon]
MNNIPKNKSAINIEGFKTKLEQIRDHNVTNSKDLEGLLIRDVTSFEEVSLIFKSNINWMLFSFGLAI